MHPWKLVAVGTIVAAALIVAFVRQGPHAFEHVGSTAPAAHITDSRQSTSAVTDPITPSENAGGGKASGSGYGWGPFRAVDW